MPHNPSDFLSLVTLAIKKEAIDIEFRDIIKILLHDSIHTNNNYSRGHDEQGKYPTHGKF